ncbi:MAG: hypothetical protein QOG86_1015 [Thermoleophilaceae bacterium]|nr:hypothetical protein [Thermoleophilaceae bacterium]
MGFRRSPEPVGLKPSKPSLQSVIDLGLRDVGVKNDPRRFAAQFGKMSIQVFALIVLSVFAMCIVVGLTGAGAWIAVPVALASTVGLLVLTLRTARRSPVVVVKVTAEGANQATWLHVAPFLVLVLCALLVRDPLLLPVVVLTGMTALIAWRARGRVPEVLRQLRPLLGADEAVLGDGAGLAQGARGWRERFRLVVATDRRVLVASAARSTTPPLLLDLPYERVSRFGVEWKYWGRVGVLSLTVAGAEGRPAETHVISSIAPANLVSIAEALQAHGVHADDPAALSEAEHAWEEARRGGESQARLLDRTAMNTREFDRGLWLLLGASAVVFYPSRFGIAVGASRNAAVLLLAFFALCGMCGYVSRTKSSLSYVVPLNLLVSPAFFFMDASDVIALMLMLSAVAIGGLWAGSALRGSTTGPAAAAASSGPRAARGSLRHAISGLGLIRLSGMLLVVVVTLVAITSAVGFELPTLRLAIFEATAKQVPVDGRSNLTGNAASLTYTPGPDLHEFITDAHADAPDGARWELRSSFTKGYNVVSLASYVEEPRLDNAAAVAAFVARKDAEHSRLAGFTVTHTERVVDGRKGYVWSHRSRHGYWYYAAWFPQPVNSLRVECIARDQLGRFKRLCAEAMRSLKFAS